MRHHQILITAVLYLAVSSFSIAQTTDLMRVEYTYIPQADSENIFSRTRAFFNFPIALDWEGSYLIPGLEFRNVNLDLNGEFPFEAKELNLFRNYRASIAYTCKWENGWRMAIKIGGELSSNFVRTDFLADDLRLNGAVFMIRDRSGDGVEKPDRLIFGLEYSSNAGRPFPLPVINYYKEFKPNWSYSLGTPKTNIKHKFAKNQTIQAFVSIDGFFGNIQNNVTFMQDDKQLTGQNMSMTSVFGAIGYEFFFSEHFLLYAYGGHTFYNEIRLRDDGRNTVYTFNDQNTFYIRTGVKFRI